MTVRIKPANALRRDFARWASAHGVRTVTAMEFGVPAALIPEIPERVLVGSLIDSLPYVPSDARRIPAPAAPVVRRPPAAAPVRPVPAVAVLRVEVDSPTTSTTSDGVDGAGAGEEETGAETSGPAADNQVAPTAAGTDSTPDTDPDAADADGDEAAGPFQDRPDGGTAVTPFCGDCQRYFKTPAGLRSHRGQVHAAPAGT